MQKQFYSDHEDYIIDDESIYSEKVRDQLMDDDEISAMEAGFMQGYDEAYA